MEDLPQKDLIEEMESLRKWNQQMLKQIESFRELGEHTVDVDSRMKVSENLAKRAQEEVFTAWKMWRFRHKRADPLMLDSMETIGGQMSEYFLEAGQAWKFPDSQHIRDEDPDLFRKREVLEGKIRDNLFTLQDMRAIAQIYRDRYGAHEHMLSERGFKWLQIAIGFLAGVASSLTVALVRRALGLDK